MKPHLELYSPERAAKVTGIVAAAVVELVVTPLLAAYDASKRVSKIGANVLSALTGRGDTGGHC